MIYEILTAAGVFVWGAGIVGSFVDNKGVWWLPCIFGGATFVFGVLLALRLGQPV